MGLVEIMLTQRYLLRRHLSPYSLRFPKFTFLYFSPYLSLWFLPPPPPIHSSSLFLSLILIGKSIDSYSAFFCIRFGSSVWFLQDTLIALEGKGEKSETFRLNNIFY